MLSLNFLSKMTRSSHVARTLATSGSARRQCGDREDKEQSRCKPSCFQDKKRKPRSCSEFEMFKKGGQGEDKRSGDGELPDYCSKQAAMECARKIKELQKQWEAVAVAASDKNKDERKRPEACAVRAPRKEEEGGKGNLLFAVGLITALVLGYYLYTQAQEKVEKEKKDDDESKPE